MNNKKILIFIILIAIFVFIFLTKGCASCSYIGGDRNFVGVCAQMCQKVPLWKLALFSFTGIKF